MDPGFTLNRPPKRVAVVVLAVEEVLLDLETAFLGELLDHLRRVFLRDLHKHRFPFVEIEIAVERPDMDRLLFAADEEAACGTLYGAVNGVVCPFDEIEVCTKLAIDPLEQVQVKFCGPPRRIVIGADNDMRVLLQVKSDK